MDKNLQVIKGGRQSSEAAEEERSVDWLMRVHEFCRTQGIKFDPLSNLFVQGQHSRTSQQLAYWMHLGNSKGGIVHKKTACAEYAAQMQLEHDRAQKARLTEVPHDSAAAALELTKLVMLMLPENASEDDAKLAMVGLRQLIWQVKRSLRGLPTASEIMLVLYSGQGTGKSSIVAELGKQLGHLYRGNADFKIFSDQFSHAQLAKYYLINFDEMGHAARTEIESIKQAITTQRIESRVMYSSDTCSAPRTASFIATTNKPLSLALTDSSGMRRFVQIRCSDKRVDERWVKRFESIDFAKLWQCEAGELSSKAPLSLCPELLAAHQSELRTEDNFEFWSKLCLKQTGEFADKVQFKELHSAYNAFLSDQGSRRCTRPYFSKLIREHFDVRHLDGRYYAWGIQLTTEDGQ